MNYLRSSIIRILSAAFMLLASAVCNESAYAADDWESSNLILGLSEERTEQPSKLRVLFIGNSHTYLEDMSHTLPQLIWGLALSQWKSLAAEKVTRAARPLEKHWKRDKARKAISNGTWEYVVLQEKLPFTYENVASMHDSIRKFHAYVQQEQPNAKVLLYMTWYRQGEAFNWPTIQSSFYDIAEELNIKVVPVGLAWHHYDTTNHSSPVMLRQTDKYHHATEAGAYLAACTFYASLFNDTSIGLPPLFLPENITDSQVMDLQEAALWAVSQYE